jgi:hypothetical protein
MLRTSRMPFWRPSETTIKRLRAGASNKSDLGGVLQTNNVHIAVCDAGRVTQTLTALEDSPATAKAKAKHVLATDGLDFEAEELTNGETVACAYKDFPDHFGFFLPLAGITTVRQIAENSFDIRATSRLNRLYLELLKDNPDWVTAERRHDMNHFMARLIFCFFAEDTDMFIGKGLFTDNIAQMSERDSSNTHEIIVSLFRSMDTKSVRTRTRPLRAYKRKASNPPATWAVTSYSKSTEAVGSIWVIWLPELTDLGDRRSGSGLINPSASDGILRHFRTHVLYRTAAEVE